MRQLYSILLALLLGLGQTWAQAPCQPDSTVPKAPGIYPPSITVEGCQAFDTTVTFILPRDTTVEVAGQTFTFPFVDFRIDGLDGLPAGVSWECNLAPTCSYVVHPDSSAVDTIGCLRLYGNSSLPGLFNVQVNVTARIDVFGDVQAQPSVFDAPVTVQPCSFQGDCYTLDFDSNCEPSQLTLTNNIPSQGQPGFVYQWTLSGPNNFLYQTTDENPFPQLLAEAGNYVIDYQLEVDTVGFVLNGLSIEAVGCSDLLDAGDLYWILLDPAGNELVNTSNSPVSNGGGSLPISTGITGLRLDTGQYEFQVWDDDLIGNDDGCATGAGGTGASLFFNIPSAQTGSLSLTSGSLQVALQLDNPIQAIACRDTFTVDSLPTQPQLLLDSSLVAGDSLRYCVGSSLLLSTDSPDSLLWFRDGDLLVDATSDTLRISDPGVYYVEAIDRQTLCRIGSRALRVDSLRVLAPTIELDSATEVFAIEAPSDSVTYRWYDLNGQVVGTGPSFEPDSNGRYFATAVDTALGCESPPTTAVDFVSGLFTPRQVLALELAPNPTDGAFVLRTHLPGAEPVALRLYDPTGRVLWTQDLGLQAGAFSHAVQLPPLPAGLYLLQVQAGAWRGLQRLRLRP